MAKVSSAGAMIAAGVKTAVSGMNKALRGIYEECAGFLHEEQLGRILAYYRIGQRAAKTLDAGTYGENAAQLLAAALELSTADLYRMRMVAETIPEEEMQKLMNRKGKLTGKKLTWSALFTIVSVQDNSKLRAKLFNEYFAHELTTRDLTAMIQGELGVRGNNRAGRPSLAPRTPAAGLAKLHRSSQTLLEQIDVMDEAIFTALADNPKEYASEEMVEELQKAYDEQVQLAETAQATARKLAAALEATQLAVQSRSDNSKAVDKAKVARKKKRAAGRDEAQVNGNGSNGEAPRKKKKVRRPEAPVAEVQPEANETPAAPRKKKAKRSPEDAIRAARGKVARTPAVSAVI